MLGIFTLHPNVQRKTSDKLTNSVQMFKNVDTMTGDFLEKTQ